MAFEIKPNIHWVGKIDWELRRFHGEEYSTHRGSSYNSYLIKDEKTVLIDTVWAPFAQEFVKDLALTVDLSTIDYIVINHGEIDHSGALPELMKLIPGTPIYCSANAVKSLRGQYHQDWNFQVVKTGDRLNIGSKELIFVEAPMLHWPDSMMCYLTGDEILFSNDAFGQHYANSYMYNDLVDQAELYQECIKYYANILAPFSKLVEKKIAEIIKLGLPLAMICPSHGILWRDKPLQIVEQYQQWANDYQEDQIVIIYDTMWNGTRRMAEEISVGITEADKNVNVKVLSSSRSDKNDILTEVFKAKAVLVGSPTVNKTVLSSIAAIMEEMKGLAFKSKQAAAFGTYGWSGESVKVINNLLTSAGCELIHDGLREMWYPDAAASERCRQFGRDFVQALKAQS